MNTCKTCRWWGEVETGFDDEYEEISLVHRRCRCPLLVDAGPDFGCVHHAAGEQG